jgi:hypothetical protein
MSMGDLKGTSDGKVIRSSTEERWRSRYGHNNGVIKESIEVIVRPFESSGSTKEASPSRASQTVSTIS